MNDCLYFQDLLTFADQIGMTVSYYAENIIIFVSDKGTSFTWTSTPESPEFFCMAQSGVDKEI